VRESAKNKPINKSTDEEKSGIEIHPRRPVCPIEATGCGTGQF
jgi:hypothetical protein